MTKKTKKKTYPVPFFILSFEFMGNIRSIILPEDATGFLYPTIPHSWELFE